MFDRLTCVIRLKKERAAGSVGIPPAAQDKARGQASLAQMLLRTAVASIVLVPRCRLKASERSALPSVADIGHLFVRKPVYLLIYSIHGPNRRG
jgi:hypothetical protein